MHTKVLSQSGVKKMGGGVGSSSLTPPVPPDDDDEFCIKCLNTCNLTFVGVVHLRLTRGLTPSVP